MSLGNNGNAWSKPRSNSGASCNPTTPATSSVNGAVHQALANPGKPPGQQHNNANVWFNRTGQTQGSGHPLPTLSPSHFPPLDSNGAAKYRGNRATANYHHNDDHRPGSFVLQDRPAQPVRPMQYAQQNAPPEFLQSSPDQWQMYYNQQLLNSGSHFPLGPAATAVINSTLPLLPAANSAPLSNYQSGLPLPLLPAANSAPLSNYQSGLPLPLLPAANSAPLSNYQSGLPPPSWSHQRPSRPESPELPPLDGIPWPLTEEVRVYVEPGVKLCYMANGQLAPKPSTWPPKPFSGTPWSPPAPPTPDIRQAYSQRLMGNFQPSTSMQTMNPADGQFMPNEPAMNQNLAKRGGYNW